ncbi:MAG: hypothetical protein A2381_05260 [Bdellovibrionales bacterium RIFOXYB1_FULL_37_110]|nr:MAG: hypothetical protein A2417_16740 [Bdellovibrionales bacterium RIFOXYC1_FULL_37_79]OFZ58154.1 MAG: hypothetical protein A2381_05260 [Bdellovibrionales bacterium RIFOXYB1_FULL_37_110]OFZ61843.1 MAG: hypothetical protein A2577_18845 [Bdellovibrionales bacterium RIFOXYD1_FULL_36_51]
MFFIKGFFNMSLETAKTIKGKNKSKISIFDFRDFKDYLNAVGFPDGNYNHQSNTLTKWAKRLGYRSPSSLTMVLKGQRLPSSEMVRTLIDDLKLQGKEKEYFELLVEHGRLQKRQKSSDSVLNRLSKLHNKTEYFQIDMGQFNTIAKWYYLVIKQLVSAPDFIEDIDWIVKKLRRKVTAAQVKKAITDLETLGLIKRQDGKIIKSEQAVMTSNDIPSSAIKEHHAGMMQMAAEALYEQPIEKRQISSLTFKMDTKKLLQAKEELMNFLNDFNEKYSDVLASEVYQLNLQLFSHTREEIEQ